MRRQENMRLPSEEQDPQRERGSRSVRRPGVRPSAAAWRSTAAARWSRARRLSRASMAGPSRPYGAAMAVPVRRADRPAPGVTVRFVPATGRVAPMATGTGALTLPTASLSQRAFSSAKARPTRSGVPLGSVSVTRPSSDETRNDTRRARAERLSDTLTSGAPLRRNSCIGLTCSCLERAYIR